MRGSLSRRCGVRGAAGGVGRRALQRAAVPGGLSVGPLVPVVPLHREERGGVHPEQESGGGAPGGPWWPALPGREGGEEELPVTDLLR